MTAIDTMRVALYGSPPSESHKPSRDGVLAAFSQVATSLSLIASGAGISKVAPTVAAINGDLAYAGGALGIVYDDPTASNNGFYVKVGASGLGGWEKTDLSVPSDFADEFNDKLLEVQTAIGAITIKKTATTAASLQEDLLHNAGSLAAVYADPTLTNNGFWIKVGASGLGGWEKTSFARNPKSPVVVAHESFDDLEIDTAYDEGSIALIYADSRGWRNGFYEKIGNSGLGGWQGIYRLSDGFAWPTLTYYPDAVRAKGTIAIGGGLMRTGSDVAGQSEGNTALGHRAGEVLERGWANTLIGMLAGQSLGDIVTSNTWGGSLGNVGNTFVGAYVAPVANGALDCTLVGTNCGLNLTTGMDIVGMGIKCIENCEAMSETVAIGHGVLQYVVGKGSLANLDSTVIDPGNAAYSWGHRVTAIGDQAGRFVNGNNTQLVQTKKSVFVGAGTTSFGQFQYNEHVFGYKAEGRGTNTMVFGNATITETTMRGKVLRLPDTTTVAALPAVATAGAGARAFVTNANVPAAGNFGTVVAGGGANAVPVYCDGAAWRIG